MQEKKLPFYVTTIGKVNHQTVVHRPLGIEHCQLLYTIHGKGNAFIEGRSFILKKNSILYLPPNVAHEYYCISDTWETIYITFGGSGLNNFWTFEPSVWNNGESFEFDKWFNILQAYKNKPNMEKELSITLYTMLLNFKEKVIYTSSSSKKKKYILTMAMHEISESDSPCLSQFAKKMGISEAHFCRIFKEYTGFRPFEYKNRLKIHQAEELLNQTDMSIKEICNTVGYESHSYFSMLFKRYIGITPKEYRQNHIQST